MALTNEGKKVAMEGPGVFGTTRYLSLHLSSKTELSGHGYARKAIRPADVSVSNAGVATIANLDVYTASDGNAQDADKVAIYDASSGGNLLYDIQDLNVDVAAPSNGQTFRLTSIRFDP